MFSFLIGSLGSIIGLVGWFGFKSVVMLVIGTAFYVIETVVEWKDLNTNAKLHDLVVFGIGSFIAAVFTSAPWYVGGMVAILINSLFLSIFGIIRLISFFK